MSNASERPVDADAVGGGRIQRRDGRVALEGVGQLAQASVDIAP